MTLLVSRKVVRSLDDVTAAFRQVEQWTLTRVNRFRYTANWQDLGGAFLPGAFFVDPFGIVHLQGTVALTGNLNAGVTATVCTLPPRYAPAGGKTAQFLTFFQNPPSVLLGINVGLVGGVTVVQATPAANTVNPSFPLDGFTYPVFG